MMKTSKLPILAGVVVLVLLAACGSGDDGVVSPDPTPLKVTVYNNGYDRKPVEGVLVSVYEADGTTILRTAQSDADGQTVFESEEFGDRKNSTVTIARQTTSQSGDASKIVTLTDLSLGNYEHFLNEKSNNCTEVGRIANATFSLASDSEVGVIAPFSLDLPVVDAKVSITDVPICQEFLNPDGTLTILVAGLSDRRANGDWGKIVYEEFLGIPVSEAVTYSGIVSRVRDSVRWTSGPTYAPTSVRVDSVTATKPSFTLFAIGTVGSVETSGQTTWARGLTRGEHSLTAIKSNVGIFEKCFDTSGFSASTTDIEVNMPDFGNPTVDLAGESIVASVPNAPTSADLIVFRLENATSQSFWTIVLPASTATVPIPDLPAELLIDRSQLTSGAWATVGYDLLEYESSKSFDDATRFSLAQLDASLNVGPYYNSVSGDSQGCIFVAAATSDPGRTEDLDPIVTDGPVAVDPPLIVASFRGDLANVQSLLSGGADPNLARESDNRTPLIFAAQEGHTDIVQALLAAGANVDRGTNDEFTPLMIASQNGHDAIVKALLDAGANVRIARANNWTALHSAVGFNQLAAVDLLLAASSPIEPAVRGFTPLTSAAQSGFDSIAQALIASGANPLGSPTTGPTPLFMAAQNDHQDIISTLLATGVDPNNGGTVKAPLLQAAGKDNIPVIEQLIAGGANVNVTDQRNGWTALFWAANNNNAAAAEKLLALGADSSIENQAGETALQLAESLGNEDVAVILRAAG